MGLSKLLLGLRCLDAGGQGLEDRPCLGCVMGYVSVGILVDSISNATARHRVVNGMHIS